MWQISLIYPGTSKILRFEQNFKIVHNFEFLVEGQNDPEYVFSKGFP